MFDVSLSHTATRTCDGNTRRDFLRVGGLTAFGLSLPALLQAADQTAATSRKRSRARSVILVYLGGGLSHLDSFDPKPGAAEEIRGEYRPIASNVPGLKIGELLPQMAKTMDKVALVRSASHNNDHHETATNWVMSGRFGSAFGDYPAIGAVVAHETGSTGVVPPYVAVPRNPSFTWELGKSAFLGVRCESFKAGDPNQKSGQVFAVDDEPEKLRDRYGRTTFGQSCLLARRLVAGGVRFVTVNFGGWDHHAKIFPSLENKLSDFDRGFSTLIHDLEERGLLGETLVVAMSEFGRTPKLNKDAGRDHWAPAGSLLMAGAGVRPGNVIGATDKQGAFVTQRPVAPADIAYTIFDSLGIEPRKHLIAPDGRSIEILDQGELVKELF